MTLPRLHMAQPDDIDVSGSSPLCVAIFSSNIICLLAYVFVCGDQQLEWLRDIESNRVYWFETRFLSLVYL